MTTVGTDDLGNVLFTGRGERMGTAAALVTDNNDEHRKGSLPNDLSGQVLQEGRDPVASGGFANIYRGLVKLNAKTIKVAIKAIKTYSDEDDDHFAKKQKRRRREMKVWLSLKHDNVLPLLGTSMGFGRFPAMVCPWAENGTLTAYLRRRYATFSVVELLRLQDNVASGLRYLHSCSVVHGDLSGVCSVTSTHDYRSVNMSAIQSNILIRENGSACIADFGLSTLLTELGGSTFATSFHGRGTIRWMAPELLALGVPENELEEETSQVLPTTHSDVYSFGGIMLQILSGKVPYYYYTRDERVLLAIHGEILPTRPRTALVTERRWTFLQRCWSTVDIIQTRPSSEEIADFTKDELASVDEGSSSFDLTGGVVQEGRDPVTSGTFGDIYRGVLKWDGKPVKVAIKVMRIYSGRDGDYFAKKQKQLRRAINVWLMAKHDNVLPLLGTTMGFGQFPAMVSPWAENGILTSYLERHYASSSVVELLRLLDNIASGLWYLHSHSIVHGDLSGLNILIRENGSPYIAGFGLSTLLTEFEGATFSGSSRRQLGTVRWMAPELLDPVPENEPEDAPRVLHTTHSDVYSFGSIMLQILSGKVPYHNYSREEQVVYAILRGITPTRPGTALFTECRWTFIQRCWSTVEIAQTRPSSEEIVVFTKSELVSVGS